MMGESIASMVGSIPALWKAITALVGAASVGASAMAFALSGQITANTRRSIATEQSQRNVIQRLERIEHEVRLNNCLELASHRGVSWRTCLEGE